MLRRAIKIRKSRVHHSLGQRLEQFDADPTLVPQGLTGLQEVGQRGKIFQDCQRNIKIPDPASPHRKRQLSAMHSRREKVHLESKTNTICRFATIR